jgi:hypothetical protein
MEQLRPIHTCVYPGTAPVAYWYRCTEYIHAQAQAHTSQLLAPGLLSVLVTEPAGHTLHHHGTTMHGTTIRGWQQLTHAHARIHIIPLHCHVDS